MNDDLDAARGVIAAILISLVLWAALFGVLMFVFR